MTISMLKIRRPLGRLIFNMGIAIPGKTVFLIETAPWNVHFHSYLYRQCACRTNIILHFTTSISSQPSHIHYNLNHYNDVIMGAMASQASRLFPQAFFRRRSKKTSMLRVTGHCDGNSPVPRTKGQQSEKCFHLMTSSWTWHKRYMSVVYHLRKCITFM